MHADFLQSRWFHVAILSAILVFTFIAYSNTLSSPFQFDDIPNIVDNTRIRSLSNLPNILRGQRGVTFATFALNYAAGGLEVEGYHIVNLLIHAANAVLAYILLYSLFSAAGAPYAWAKLVSALSSLVFALHPVQTQAVTYIVQRMESLAALFYMLSLVFFIRSAAAATSGGRAFLWACVALSYALGFYSKEVAFTLPAVILLLDVCFLSRGSLRPLLKRWPLYAALSVLTVFFAVNTIMPLGGFNDLSGESSIEAKTSPDSVPGPGEASQTIKGGGGVTGGAGSAQAFQAQAAPGAVQTPKAGMKEPTAGFGVKGISPKEYLLTEFNVLLYYLALLPVPANQNLDYDYPTAASLFEAPQVNEGAALNIKPLAPVIPLAILLIILAFAVYALIRSMKTGSIRLKAVSFFILWFFIILAPTSSIMPILDVIFEHRLYLPSLGYFTVAVIAIESLLRLIPGRAGA